MTEQAEPSESQESKTPGALTRWPRDLTDLWAGWAPFGATGWPFRDIKVEEFIDGDHLVVLDVAAEHLLTAEFLKPEALGVRVAAVSR